MFPLKLNQQEAAGGVSKCSVFLQPAKKKKVRPSGDSDDDVRGEAAVEKRQAAKRRKRSEKDKLPRTVFVGNLPASVKKKELKKEFAQYGPVESVRLRSLALQEVSQAGQGAQPRGGDLSWCQTLLLHGIRCYS